MRGSPRRLVSSLEALTLRTVEDLFSLVSQVALVGCGASCSAFPSLASLPVRSRLPLVPRGLVSGRRYIQTMDELGCILMLGFVRCFVVRDLAVVTLHEKEVCGVPVSVSPREKGVSAQVPVVEEDMCDMNLTGGLGGL